MLNDISPDFAKIKADVFEIQTKILDATYKKIYEAITPITEQTQLMMQEIIKSYASVIKQELTTKIDINQVVLSISAIAKSIEQSSFYDVKMIEQEDNKKIELDDNLVEQLTDIVENVVTEENEDKGRLLDSIKNKMPLERLFAIITSLFLPLLFFAYETINSHIDSLKQEKETAEIIEELKNSNQKQDEILRTIHQLTDYVQENLD
jgi:hypothetical protein